MKFGQYIHAVEVVDSTMDLARDLLRAGAPPGTVVTAEYQTAGRGRQGRVWHAPRGANVMLTAIGEPVPTADAWQIALVGAVGVASGIVDTALVWPTVKFPNDVLLLGKKVSGVLVEVVTTDDPQAVIPLIGIGVNVRRSADDLPPEIAELATSLEAVVPPEPNRYLSVPEVQQFILHHLTATWEKWRQEGPEPLLREWKQFADPEARRVFLLDGAPVSCRVLDLAADGTITLETLDGTQRSMNAAQVILD